MSTKVDRLLREMWGSPDAVNLLPLASAASRISCLLRKANKLKFNTVNVDQLYYNSCFKVFLTFSFASLRKKVIFVHRNPFAQIFFKWMMNPLLYIYVHWLLMPWSRFRRWTAWLLNYMFLKPTLHASIKQILRVGTPCTVAPLTRLVVWVTILDFINDVCDCWKNSLYEQCELSSLFSK